MILTPLGISVVLISLILFVIAFKLLFSKGWFFAWLRGSFAIVFLLLGLFFVIFLSDLMGFSSFNPDEQIARITVRQQGPQSFVVAVIPKNGEIQTFRLAGEMWQLDVRMIVWRDVFAAMGVEPVYRFDRISGRYASIEDEKQRERTVYDLNEHFTPLDAWHVLASNTWIPGVVTKQGAGTFVPMYDGAHYTVFLNQGGLTTVAANDQARAALRAWN